MASDKDHRPCLPLKPQEKFLNILNKINKVNNHRVVLFTNLNKGNLVFEKDRKSSEWVANIAYYNTNIILIFNFHIFLLTLLQLLLFYFFCSCTRSAGQFFSSAY